MINNLLKILCIIPFVSILCIILYIAIAYVDFGHIPIYAIDIDPTQFGFKTFYRVVMVFVLLSIFSVPFLIVSILIILIKGRPFRNLLPYLLVCSISVLAFLIIRLCYFRTFLWFFD